MPYIKNVDRGKFDHILESLHELGALTTGELNYFISMVLHQFVEEHGLCYSTLNAVVGMMECAKTEFQRRVVAPYEDKKIQENGDLDG